MSQSLKMVNAQIERFRTGELDLSQMWSVIDEKFGQSPREEGIGDPFDDDKTDRRLPLLSQHGEHFISVRS